MNTNLPRRALLTLEFMPSHGGIERLLHERAKSHSPERLTVFAPWVEGCREFDARQPYEVVRVTGALLRIPFFRRFAQVVLPTLAFLRHHRRNPFSEIECGQALPFSLLGLWLHRRGGIPYLVWVHGNDLLVPLKFPLLSALLKSALKNASRILANSRFVASLVSEQGVPESRIRVLSHFVDTSLFFPGPAPAEFLSKYGLENRTILLTVGRLVERKGVDQVIRALPSLVETVPDLLYLVVGSGPMLDSWKSLAGELNVDRFVRFTGPVPHEELPLFYRAADIFVMVSRYLENKGSVEGLGLVYLEASASGIPVIAGRSGGVSDAVEDGVSGYLVDPASPLELTDALRRVLGNPSLARSLGEKGLARVLRPRDWTALSVT
jgi:phosphatidylinositol alpha-1,6-mannosyltransferase